MSGAGESLPPRICTYCGDPKPATTEFFSPRRDGKAGGLQSPCKVCKAAIKRAKSRGLPAPPRRYEPPPPPPDKRCYVCGDIKPLSAFHKCSGTYQGVQAKCIECKNKHGYGRVWKNAPSGYRYCSNTDCLQKNPQPLHNFYKDKSKKEGREYSCKACKRSDSERKAYLRDYNKKNNPRVTAQKRSHYQKNRKSIRAAQSEYWSIPENRERKILAGKAYVASGRSKELAKLRHERNPLLLRTHWANRRARERNAPGRYTAADIAAKLELQGGLCYYCHTPLFEFDIEHKIPLIRGGSNWPANIALSCPSCNGSKGPGDFWQFLERGHGAPPFRFIRLHQTTGRVPRACP